MPKVNAVKAIATRLIGIEYDDLKEMAKNEEKRVIAISGGSMKVEAIHSAIKGKLINVLIVDELTARLLKLRCQKEIEDIEETLKT